MAVKQSSQNPQQMYPLPPYPEQEQEYPGLESQMNPLPEFGKETYTGSNKLEDKVAVITGGDSGIGRAVATLYAKEGADIAISYLSEHDDAEETRRVVEAAGRRCILIPGDIQDKSHCKTIIGEVNSHFGSIDVLVNNAAFQNSVKSITDVKEEDLDRTFRTNIYAMFFLTQAAFPHINEGVIDY